MINTYNNVPLPVWITDAATDYTYNGGNMSVSLPATPYPGNGTITAVTVTDNTSGPWTFTDTALSSPESGKIKLTGKNPDIEIGEHSLMEILEGIRRQLGLIKLDPDLEEEFEELRKIGDEYRAKEKELHEKRKVWETLKR